MHLEKQNKKLTRAQEISKISLTSEELTDTLKDCKVNKFNVAVKEERTYRGKTFDSKFEMKSFRWLKALLPGKRFKTQVKYELQEAFVDNLGVKHRAINYYADFVLKNKKVTLVLDAKGMMTPEFKLKEKLFKHKYRDVVHLCFKNKQQLIDILKKYEFLTED